MFAHLIRTSKKDTILENHFNISLTKLKTFKNIKAVEYSHKLKKEGTSI